MKVTIPSLAKINLDLRVIHKRADKYHELRTIFQTVSLHDRLVIAFAKARRTEVTLESSVQIADNLVLRAAQLVLEHMKVHARIEMSLLKRIPMGAGLGGGSSNAAAALIALPALAGRKVPLAELLALAETLGSDVPFFLHGGTALGLGKGSEVYPLPDQPARDALLVATGIHVSTATAYQALARDVTSALTSSAESLILREFQSVAWNLPIASLNKLPLQNDFEPAVFRQHPELAAVARKLKRLGAQPALMTGSGSALFGLFSDSSQALAAASHFPVGTAYPVRFVTRKQYRSQWQRALGPVAASSCFAGT